jgi:hypothetical protein
MERIKNYRRIKKIFIKIKNGDREIKINYYPINIKDYISIKLLWKHFPFNGLAELETFEKTKPQVVKWLNDFQKKHPADWGIILRHLLIIGVF